MSAIHEESVYVTAVRIEYAGSTLAGDHASGVSELVVDDAFEFNEGGGLLSVNGDVLTYTRWDDDTNTITLAAPTSSAYDDKDRVLVSPLAPVKVADVVDIEGASYEAIVWHTLSAMLPETIFGPDEQPTGTIFYTGDHDKVWLVNCPGRTPAIDPAALPSDGGDLDPDTESIFLDGPPDFWTTSQYGKGTYLTQGGMEAVADPVWIAAVAGIEFDNGTISFPTGTLPSNVFPKYYPVWLVPIAGRQCRVVVDSVTPGGGSEDQSAFAINTALQSEAHDFADGWTDTFWYLAEVTPSFSLSEFEWRGYADLDGGAAPGGIQVPPVHSLTQDESASIYYGDYDAVAPVQPLMAVTLFEPFADWAASPFLSDAGCTVTGVRVELL